MKLTIDTEAIKDGDKVLGKKFPIEGLLFEVENTKEDGQWLFCKGIGEDNPFEYLSIGYWDVELAPSK